jgi:rhodanese-related sulfurtransferase
MTTRTFSKLICLLALAPVVNGQNADTKDLPPHTTDDLKTVKAAVESGKAILLDVRSQKEWDAGHVKGAIFLPWLELQSTKGAPFDKLKLDKSKVVYTYCHVGIRSAKAAAMFREKGYDARALKPGFAELAEAGFPAEKPEVKPTHTTDDLKTVKAAVESGKAVILDVRSKNEWEAGHVKGAVFTPITDLEKTSAESFLKLKPDKSKVYYTHCGAGGRALRAATMLKKEGYDVRALKPGFAELIDAGFPEAAPEK